jgi:thiol-disulfide isomerase/thioredoxin
MVVLKLIKTFRLAASRIKSGLSASVNMRHIALVIIGTLTAGPMVQACNYRVNQAPGPTITISPTQNPALTPTTRAANLPDLGPAPELAGVNHWLNSEPLTIQGLQGKVILVNFWTYSCINCIHTLPYVTGWYEKYKDQGFVIIGVHTPEFAFEHDTANVEQAIKRFSIAYPVAQDNDYATWQAYNNRYWPAEYLIDARGHLRLVHFGEGNYTETEAAIQELLAEAGTVGDATP